MVAWVLHSLLTAALVLSASGHAADPCCRRQVLLAIAATSAAAATPGPANAITARRVIPDAQAMEALLSAHARQFRRSSPAAVAALLYEGRSIRQLVASTDVPAFTRVAVYPVEVVSDEDERDDSYSVGIYSEVERYGRVLRREVQDVSGIPTRRSLALPYADGLPTNAMFANEPDASHLPNCVLTFPTVRGTRIRLGDVCYAYLETIASVKKGDALTWCYGDGYTDRGYPTTCADSWGGVGVDIGSQVR